MPIIATRSVKFFIAGPPEKVFLFRSALTSPLPLQASDNKSPERSPESL
jgi:hypothetical protein